MFKKALTKCFISILEMAHYYSFCIAQNKYILHFTKQSTPWQVQCTLTNNAMHFIFPFEWFLMLLYPKMKNRCHYRFMVDLCSSYVLYLVCTVGHSEQCYWYCIVPWSTINVLHAELCFVSGMWSVTEAKCWQKPSRREAGVTRDVFGRGGILKQWPNVLI